MQPNRPPAPNQTNWQYGYTLGPPSQANNGDYQVYQNHQQYQQQQQQHYYGQQSGQHQQQSNNIAVTTTTQQPKSWSDIKPKVSPAYFKTKVFVTSSKALPGTMTATTATPATTGVTSTSAVASVTCTSAMIGPSRPDDGTEDDTAFGSACSQLHDLAMQNKIPEKYESAAEPGAGFMVTLTLGTETYRGRGSTIKAAKQNAAMQALANTAYKTRMTMKARPSGITPTSELHELATKKGLNVDFNFIEPYNFNYNKGMKMWKKEEMRGHYKVQLKVGALEFMGEGDLPQVAKHNAAIQGIPTIRNLPDAKSLVASVAVAVASAGDVSSSTNTSYEAFKNPVMQINELAITHGIHAEWDMLSDEGPPHMKSFKWQLKMGDKVSVGAGASKKIARSQAASNMLAQLPDELKVLGKPALSPAKKGKKRKNQAAAMAPPGTMMPPPLVPGTEEPGPVIDPSMPKQPKLEPAEPFTQIMAAGIPITISTASHKNKKGAIPAKGTPVHKVILNSSPISALHEYCRKANKNEPEFDCVSENVLETWQKDNHTFKKIEYTMRLSVADKTYFATGNTKKVAKTRAAEEAWNIIRAGTF